MKRLHIISLLLTGLIVLNIPSNAQILKKIKKTAKDIKDAANAVKGATNEAKQTVKSYNELKKSWKKDTSANIRYQQVPDYRNREEVAISKKQQLSIENGTFVNLSWQPVTKFDNQIFPSFIIGWASYKGEKTEDMGSSLGFYINTGLSNVVLKWEIESMDKSFFNIDSGYIRYDDMKYNNTFMPRISWDPKALTKHKSSAPLNVYFRLIDPNTGNKVEKLVNVNLRSINDCIVCHKQTKYNYMFASYVNEEHPEIDKILRQMLDTKMIDKVLGYQRGENYADLQVAALWRVLHDRGFQYSSITDNSGFNDGSCNSVFSQTVRTFENCLSTNQANCVDGTVFMASILKRIGIRTILVNVPGHCFLGYFMDDTTQNNIHFLETTWLSRDNYIKNPKLAIQKKQTVITTNISKELNLSELNKAYYIQFNEAAERGAQNIIDNVKQHGAASIKFIIVENERKYIKPIPYYE